MQEEPDIVKILREEERLGRLQTKLLENTGDKSLSENDTSNEPQRSVILLPPDADKNLKGPNEEYSNAIWHTILHYAPIALLIFDEQERLISWNAYAEELLGDFTKKVFRHSVKELYPSEEWIKLQKNLTQVHGLGQQIESKIYTSNDQLLDISISLCVLRDNNNIPLGTLHLFRDITAEKQAVQRLNTIAEYGEDSVYLVDRQSRYLSVNNHALSQLDCTRDKVIGKTFSDFHTPKETKEFYEKLEWVFVHKQPLKDVHHKNAKWFLRIFNPLKGTSGSHPSAVLVVTKDITEQKKLGELLKEKEKNYRTMLEFSPQLIFLIDTKGTISDVNNRITEWLGYKTQETIGKNLFSSPFFTEETQAIMKKRLSKKPSSISNSHDHIEMLTEYGAKRIGIVHTTPLKNGHNRIMGHLLVISEITQQKQMEETIRIKESAIASTITAIAFADIEGKITYVNTSFLKMWGYQSESDVIGKSMAQFWKIKEEYKEVLENLRDKNEWVGEFTGVKRNHSTIQVHLSANMIRGEGNKHVCIIGSFIDITQYKTSVKALSESEKKFRVVLENSLYMIYQLNLKKGHYDYISPSSSKVIGYSPQEMTFFGLKQIEEMIHPEDRERVNQHIKELIGAKKTATNVVRVVEYRFKHKTLGYRWMSDTCSTIVDEKNEPIALIGNIEDITERKKIWDSLVKSEEKYRILAETSADGVFTTDALGRLTYINPSIEKMLGRRKSQILATPFRKYLLEDSIYFFQQVFIDVRKKNEKIENVELEIVAEDGTILPIEVNIAPLEKQDEFSGVVCTVRNITQRREIEDELKKNERLKTEFMNIAAHELRSPVTPIKGYLDLIIHDNEVNEKIKNWAKISLRNAERLLKLVNDILDVARLDSDTMRFDMEKIDPIELLTEIVEDVKPAIINKKLEFRVNVPTSLPHLLGDKNRLSQVFKNLIGNALKFTDYGYIALEAEKKENHLIISVSDTGIGISKDEIKKIFTKFYQAYTGEDRNNEGTGLGLFISKEIVKKHNGTIWAESEVGKGSRFVVELPYIYKMTVDFTT